MGSQYGTVGLLKLTSFEYVGNRSANLARFPQCGLKMCANSFVELHSKMQSNTNFSIV